MKEYFEIYLEDNKIDFCFEYNFENQKKYKIKIKCIKLLNNMSDMFSYCSSLTSLNLSNFNTNNVNIMSGMFSHCSSLTSLDFYNFNTNNVKYMNNKHYYSSMNINVNVFA